MLDQPNLALSHGDAVALAEATDKLLHAKDEMAVAAIVRCLARAFPSSLTNRPS